MNLFRSICMIVLTILPFTEEMYILNIVLITRNVVSRTKSNTSIDLTLGITIFNNSHILL